MGDGVVENEVHLVFECPKYLNYQIIRVGFTDIFRRLMIGNVMGTIALTDTDDMMRTFFTQERQLEEAEFVRCGGTQYPVLVPYFLHPAL